jgi:hypothetical protein
MFPANELLVTTKVELKEHLGASGWVDISPLKPDLLDAQRQQLRPLLGNAQMEAIVTKYYTTTPPWTPKELKLVYLCQKLIINYALSQYQALGSIDFSGAGIRIAESAEFKSAKQWQVDDLREYFFTKAYRAMDELLEYLEAEKATFTAWAADEAAFTINKKFIVTDAATFQQYHDIQCSRRTFLGLQPAMTATEAHTIETALGTPLYDRIKTEIKSGTISEDIKKILPWLQAATAKYTIARSVDSNLIEVRRDGLYLRQYAANSGSNAIRQRNVPDPLALQRLSHSASSEGQQWLQKVIKYLNANASAEKYLEWHTSDLYTDPAGKQIAYNDNECAKTFLL